MLKAGAKKDGKEVRSIAKTAMASHYVIDEDNESQQKYIGLHATVISAAQKRSAKIKQVHSLALVFLNAIMSASGLGRSMINAVLFVKPEDDELSDLRAIVIIDAGRIIHDSIEARGRATEIVSEYQKRGGFELFCDSEVFDNATIIDWLQIFDNANKNSLADKVPRDPIFYAFIAAAIFIAAGQGAYYYLVTIPERKAEEARRKAEADKTPVYLKKLREEMVQVGWDRTSLLKFLINLDSQVAFQKGWGLKNMECDVQLCTEAWTRHGGIVNDLMATRPGADYMPQESIPDKVAILKMLSKGQAGQITDEDITPSGVEVHKLMKPALNTLINAGANAQWGETSVWPNMPMTGVRPDVIVKRTRFEVSFKYPYAAEIINQMPKGFMPEKISIGFEQDMNITIKGFVYEK